MKTTETTQPTPRSNSPAPAWTPGPWRIGQYDGEFAIYDAEQYKLVSLPTWRGEAAAEAAANARLISLAPDMAEALAACIIQLNRETLGGEALDRARALLARINGNIHP